MQNKSRLADILSSPLLNQFTPFSSKISDYFWRRCSYGGELEICVDSGIFKTGLKITIVHRKGVSIRIVSFCISVLC